MDKVAVAIGGSVLIAAFMFIAPTLGVLGGSFSGWVVGLLWPNTTAAWRAFLHLPFAMWQIGAALGFVGSFFRASLRTEKAKAE